jgi:hypothetical protein
MLVVDEQYGPDRIDELPRLVGGPLCQQVGHSSGAFLEMKLRWHGERISVQVSQRSVLGLHPTMGRGSSTRMHDGARLGRPADSAIF